MRSFPKEEHTSIWILLDYNKKLLIRQKLVVGQERRSLIDGCVCGEKWKQDCRIFHVLGFWSDDVRGADLAPFCEERQKKAQ